jgi:hypothetical protein
VIADWKHSFVFKKAMKREALKRNLEVKAEYDVDEDDEKIHMTI